MNESPPQRSTLAQLTAAAVSDMDEDTLTHTFQQTCILVRVQCRALGLSRTDKPSSDDINKMKRSTPGAARVVVSRLPGADTQHKRIIGVQAATKAVLDSESMPCHGEDNWRILPNTRMEPLLVKLNQCNEDFKLALAELERDADTILGEASINKGDFNIDIPTRDELIGAYSMHTQFKPIPDAASFKHLPDVIAKKLARHLNRQLVQAVEESQRDTLHRFVEPLQAFVERMKAYDKRVEELNKGGDPGRTGVFRDSVVTNIKELHEVLDSFNIAGDERLTELSHMLTTLAQTDPNELRKSDSLRELAMKRAESTLANLDRWLQPLPQGVNP